MTRYRFITIQALRSLFAVAFAMVIMTVGVAAEPIGGDVALHGMLPQKDAWRAYKARFVTAQGRVVDTANGLVSHSEGQGYGMLLAVAADDRDSFERIWGWTRANLFVRNDELAAWRWEPGKRPAVADVNNASDGDLLIAWALVEAATAWPDLSYRVAARRMALDIGRKLVLFNTSMGSLLLPGASGFAAEDRADGPVLNLSYYVFPAFARLPLVAPEFDWNSLVTTGLRMIDNAHFGLAKLPSDWVALKSGQLQPAAGFTAEFSYNAIRIPLYLAWAGFDQPRYHSSFLEVWGKRGSRGFPLVDLAKGQPSAWVEEASYEGIPALSACAMKGVSFPSHLRSAQALDHYYPATLQLLTLIAARMRYPACLKD